MALAGRWTEGDGEQIVRRTAYRRATVVFLIAVVFLEMQFMRGSGDLNLGNVAMAAGGILAIIITAMTSRGRSLIVGLRIQDWFFLAWLAWATLSCMWSPNRVATVVGAFYLFAMWASCTVLSRVPIEFVLKTFVYIGVVLAVISLAMIFVMPGYAFQDKSSTGLPELKGIFGHQLWLGMYMSLCIGLMVLAILNRRATIFARRPIVSFGIFVVISLAMLASLARSYIGFMVMAVAVTVGLSRKGYIRTITIIGLMVLTIFVYFNLDMIVANFADEGGDVTLTGRTRTWDITYQASQDTLVSGHGFASFASPMFDYLWRLYRPAHAHNSFYNSLFETGYVGVVLLVLFFLSQLYTTFSAARLRREYSYSFFLVIMTFASSLTGTQYGGKATILFCLMMFCVAIDSRIVAPRNDVMRRRRTPGSSQSAIEATFAAEPKKT